MTCIHDNEVNNISECNLLNDILNPPKRTKILNGHYYFILHGRINSRKGKERFKKILILLEIGRSSTIVMGRKVEKYTQKKSCDAVAHSSW